MIIEESYRISSTFGEGIPLEIFSEASKKCEFCSEEIPLNARRCPYCGSLLKACNGSYGFSQIVPDVLPAEDIEIKPQADVSVLTNVESKPQAEISVVTEGSKTENRNSYSISQGPVAAGSEAKPLSNGIKVLLTIIATIIPGLGQLIGVIFSIVFMNDQDDKDKRSFRIALLTASIVLFVLTCLFWFLILLAFFTAGA